jgi:hypothetical protein
MTPVILLEELKKFITQETKDLILKVKDSKKRRPAEVHLMRLPDMTDRIQRVPYLLLQFIKNTDEQQTGELTESVSMVRIVAAAYSENESEGSLDVLNLLTRIRTALLKERVIGKQFILKPPLEMMIYPDDTAPYYIGEIMSSWQMPPIEREVSKIWQ